MGSSHKTDLAKSRIVVVESNVLMKAVLICSASAISVVLTFVLITVIDLPVGQMICQEVTNKAFIVNNNSLWFGTVIFCLSFVFPVYGGRYNKSSMYNWTYAPWEQYPKNLRHFEIQNPMSVVSDFFSANSVKGHRRQLKEWRYYVVNDEHYDDKLHGPCTLLFTYDINLRILEAMYLLLVDSKNFSNRRKKVTEAQLIEEKEQWSFYPENLSLKEQLAPYKAIKKIFKKIKPQEYRDQLHEWSHQALNNSADVESIYAGEVINIYENLKKLYSAAWLIYQREGGRPELKMNTSETAP